MWNSFVGRGIFQFLYLIIFGALNTISYFSLKERSIHLWVYQT